MLLYNCDLNKVLRERRVGYARKSKLSPEKEARKALVVERSANYPINRLFKRSIKRAFKQKKRLVETRWGALIMKKGKGPTGQAVLEQKRCLNKIRRQRIPEGWAQVFRWWTLYCAAPNKKKKLVRREEL